MTARGAKATCDTYFSKLVRARGRCERCGTTTGPFECAHVIRRRFVGDPDGVPLRHNLLNAWCLCRACHQLVDSDAVPFAALVEATIGLGAYEELQVVRRAHHRGWREADWVRERARLRLLLQGLDG